MDRDVLSRPEPRDDDRDQTERLVNKTIHVVSWYFNLPEQVIFEKIKTNKDLLKVFIYLIEKTARNSRVAVNRLTLATELRISSRRYYGLKKQIAEELKDGEWSYPYIYDRMRGPLG